MLIVRVTTRDGRGLITFMDVGQADSALVHLKNGGVVLIDAGGDYSDYGVFRMEYPSCVIDLVVLTHFHSDHVSGMSSITDFCKIQLVTFNDINTGDYPIDIFSKNKVVPATTYISLTNSISYYKFTFGSETVYTFLPKTSDPNGSVVVLIDSGSYEILITGDAPGVTLDQLAKLPFFKDLIDKPLEIYKLPHHGSKTGISELIFTNFSPQNCIVSVGVNSYGHPSKETLSLAEKHACKTYLTKYLGDIEFSF